MQTSKTFSIHFWIKTTRNKGVMAPIYARITIDQKRTEISLKRFTEVTYWDQEIKRSSAKTPQAKALNLYLDQVHADLLECHRQLKKELVLVTAQGVKARFLGEDQQFKSLMDLVNYHKTSMVSTLKWSTLKNYNTTENYLKRYLDNRMSTNDIYLNQLNYAFIIDFEHYLRTGRSINKGQPLHNNGIMKHLERLKKLLNLAVKLEWVDKHPFARFSLKFQKFDRDYLSKLELERLESLELAEEGIKITRDIFVFSCYTGLPYSDVKALRERHIVRGIDGEYWIFTKRQKNDQSVKLPLLKKALDILGRYADPAAPADQALLPIPTNQKINRDLKELATMLHINKKLSFHSARHTFATTVTLSNGVPIETVSKLLGHSRISTTQIYSRVLEEKVSTDMGSLRRALNEAIDEPEKNPNFLKNDTQFKSLR